MGTLELPDPETFQPVPPALLAPDLDERLPIVPAELETGPDHLPRSGSACRFCGMRAAADAQRVGGTYRIPADTEAPADATKVQRVSLGPDALQDEQARTARKAGDFHALSRAKAGRVVKEVTVPTWRVCSACEALGRDPEPMAVMFAALGTTGRFPRTPTTLYLAERHRVPAYHATGGQPTDRGSREPWAHAVTETAAAAGLLAELESAGGVPAPVGSGCGICGRSHSPYGWREGTWRPPGRASATPLAVALCDGFRVEPGDRSRHPHAQPVRRRVGCARLVEMPPEAGPFIERIHAAATRDGAEGPHPWTVLPDERDRFLAWTHPAFRGHLAGMPAGAPRPPWWHLADVPVAPPSAEQRLAELEKRLAEVSA